MKLKALFAQVSGLGGQIRHTAAGIKTALIENQFVGAILDIRDAIQMHFDKVRKSQVEFQDRLQKIGIERASGMTQDELTIALHGRAGTHAHYKKLNEGRHL